MRVRPKTRKEMSKRGCINYWESFWALAKLNDASQTRLWSSFRDSEWAQKADFANFLLHFSRHVNLTKESLRSCSFTPIEKLHFGDVVLYLPCKSLFGAVFRLRPESAECRELGGCPLAIGVRGFPTCRLAFHCPVAPPSTARPPGLALGNHERLPCH
jgi:hypothetical protein